MKGYPIEPTSPVNQMIGLEITGNVVPLPWFGHIKGENGKPNSLAILILADIVYWYRPIEERDETTGEFVGYKKRFAADLLQRGYGAFAKQYCFTKEQTRDALVLLRSLGLISLEFRTVKNGDQKLGNVMFIGLNVSRLKEITFSSTLVGKNQQGGIGNFLQGYGKNPITPSGKFPMTNTENTFTETTTENSVLGRDPAPACDGESIVKNTGALEAIRKFQEKNPRGEFDYSIYPEEVCGIIREFCKLWNHRPPARSPKKGGEFALWINEARELKDACGEFGFDALKAAYQEWQDTPLDDRFMVGRPGAVTKITRATAAKMRSKKTSENPARSWEQFLYEWHERFPERGEPTDADYKKYLMVTAR